jgi:hypothetical protein
MMEYVRAIALYLANAPIKAAHISKNCIVCDCRSPACDVLLALFVLMDESFESGGSFPEPAAHVFSTSIGIGSDCARLLRIDGRTGIDTEA